MKFVTVIGLLAFVGVLCNGQDTIDAMNGEDGMGMGGTTDVVVMGSGSGSGSGDDENCKYTQCLNDGECMRNDEGFEWCTCMQGYGGELCQSKMGECSTSTCENDGICYATEGVITCVCMEGFSGLSCENTDDSRKCPVIEEGDSLFLPACSLKVTLAKIAGCINEQLPFLQRPFSEHGMCRGRVQSAFRCMTKVIDACSTVTCLSFYSSAKFLEIYTTKIAPALYNPKSPLRNMIYEWMCVLNQDGTFQGLPESDFGSPMCHNGTVREFVGIVNSYFGKMLSGSHESQEYCEIKDELKQALYHSVQGNCDWSIRPENTDDIEAAGFQAAFTIAHNFFLEWFTPECMDQGSGMSSGDDGQCMYTICQNGGKCMLTEDEDEVCLCMLSYTGELCESMMGECSQSTCENGGTCYLTNGVISCICMEGYSGPMCENRDESRRCAVVTEGDSIFFPGCSLKTTLAKASECINMQLPFTEPSLSDHGKCRGKVHTAIRCITKVITDCSTVGPCRSVWEVPEFIAIFSAHIAPALYDPTSSFRSTVYNWMCVLDTSEKFQQLPDFDFGSPVCKDDILQSLVRVVNAHADKLFSGSSDVKELCTNLNDMKLGIYNTVQDNCDFSKLSKVFPGEVGQAFQHAFVVAHKYFLEWVVPVCVGVDIDGGSACRQMTPTSSQCEMAEVWMCEFNSYIKSMIEWKTGFVEYLQTCDAVQGRNWNQWAKFMGLKESKDSRKTSHGIEGFMNVIRANVECPAQAYLDCRGGKVVHHQNHMGCEMSYCEGHTPDSRQLFAVWMSTQKAHQLVTKIHSVLSKECASSSGSSDCGSGTVTTTYPGSTTKPWTMPTTDFMTSTSGQGQTSTHSTPPSMPPTTFTTSTTRQP